MSSTAHIKHEFTEHDKLEDVRLQVEEVRTVMHSNIDKAITRGENLDELQIRAARLEEDSRRFNDCAKNVHTTYNTRRSSSNFYIIVSAAFVFTIIVLIIWGSTKSS